MQRDISPLSVFHTPHWATSCWILIDPAASTAILRHSFLRFYVSILNIHIPVQRVCILTNPTYSTGHSLVLVPLEFAFGSKSGDNTRCWLWVLVELMGQAEPSPQLKTHLMKMVLPKLWEGHRRPCEAGDHFLKHALDLLSLVQHKVTYASLYCDK